MGLLQHALLVSGKDHKQLVILTFWLWLPLSSGFNTCFKILRHFSCCIQLSWRWCMSDLADEMIRVADTDSCWGGQVAYYSCMQKPYLLNRSLGDSDYLISVSSFEITIIYCKVQITACNSNVWLKKIFLKQPGLKSHIFLFIHNWFFYLTYFPDNPKRDTR